MSETEKNEKPAATDEEDNIDSGGMGSNPSASKIFDPGSQSPVFKKDLYADLEKIEARGKRRKGFSIFSRNKK